MEIHPLCSKCPDTAACAAAFEAYLLEKGYEVVLRTTHATKPDSIHLHFRKLRERNGTLEYTADPAQARCWLSWRAGRYQDWIPEAVEIAKGFDCKATHR